MIATEGIGADQSPVDTAKRRLDAGDVQGAIDALGLVLGRLGGEPRGAALRMMWKIVDLYRCHGEVADAVACWQAQSPREFALLELLLYTTAELHEMQAARDAFTEMLSQISKPEHVITLNRSVPRLYPADARMGAQADLLHALDRIAPRPRQTLPALQARASLALARGDTEQFLALMKNARDAGVRHGQFDLLYAMEERLRAFRASGGRVPKVFCIGLSKTGTTSLNTALQMLGLTSDHWRNSVTGALLGDADIPLFDALSDTSIAYRFEEWHARFPEAWFIYTHRDFAPWEKSLIGQLAAHYRDRESQTFESMAAHHRGPGEVQHGEEWRRIHGSLYFDHASLHDAWTAFDKRVRSYFAARPQARFLSLDVIGGQGWPELCGFLGIPVPSAPFPWAYKSRQR